MYHSTLVKWAVAALLAVPAVPVLARTVHHKSLVTRSHRTLVVTGKRHHRSLKTTHRRSTLLAAKALKRHHSLTTRHHRIHKSALSSTSHFRVHFTKMPPTIDGIRS
ncbi:MAG TPA: hypothetical protein VHX86_15295 [Tepidisphaeraceae bacterium]|jgi:hypothetical protein|nr:hypothetical protein [Tepidisphaeraceae bacterium]